MNATAQSTSAQRGVLRASSVGRASSKSQRIVTSSTFKQQWGKAHLGKKLSFSTTLRTKKGAVSQQASSRNGTAFSVCALADPNSVTVSDTKKKFYELYPKPLPALYTNIIQELLVQHHLIKFQVKHQYDKIYALGFISVYDGIMAGFPEDKEKLLSSYLGALGDDVTTYREDSSALVTWASSLSGVDDIVADAGGSPFQQEFADYASGFSSKSRQYNKFFAIGMFRLLELASSTDPASLEKLSSSLGAPLSKVTSDLATYKGMLSKMTKAKELMDEIIAEQRKKTAQREQERMEKSDQSSNVEPNGGSPPAPSAA